MVVLFTPLRSASKPGTKAGNVAGEIWSCKLILKQAEKSWFGRHKGEHDLQRIGRFAPATVQSKVPYLKFFESHHIEEEKTATYPFFLAINHNAWRSKSTWCKVSPLGKNQIGQFLPEAAKNADLQAC